jgi:hypothetical protein
MGKARESLEGPLCFVIVVYQYQEVLRAIMMWGGFVHYFRK